MGAKEFYLNVGDKRIETFIYDGFLKRKVGASPIHKHKYAEVHFTECGECRILVGNDKFASVAGTVTVIPAGMPHSLCTMSEKIQHAAFFINYRVDETVQVRILPELLKELGEEIRAYKTGDDFTRIASYLSFICKDVVAGKAELRDVKNCEFLIHEFFETRYNEDVTLGDLAAAINFSAKQTARLVKKHTGMTFSEVLVSYRINAAKQLIENCPLISMSSVAEQVGYKSYSGFWRAYKRDGVRI